MSYTYLKSLTGALITAFALSAGAASENEDNSPAVNTGPITQACAGAETVGDALECYGALVQSEKVIEIGFESAVAQSGIMNEPEKLEKLQEAFMNAIFSPVCEQAMEVNTYANALALQAMVQPNIKAEPLTGEDKAELSKDLTISASCTDLVLKTLSAHDQAFEDLAKNTGQPYLDDIRAAAKSVNSRLGM